MKKAKINDIVEVVWGDAICDSKAKKSVVEDTNPTDLLCITKTYGILFKEDSNAVTIIQEDSNITIDYTVIPKGWIIEINKLIKYNENSY